ncbi:Erythromycin esterase-like protein [Cupriavidus necator]|uniref:Erythromycin esterase family protein n=1 Tax=Cupriavidus necator (strain ATCC 17699 / DSM 428 / KCTC 22496 / NCIMB 10442 / H16 / Stanier 337) TaxID=381666 RepID=Q0K0Y6_CUPNH|nr:erythromycin esterase family protein [Cupriavidus necator]QCC04180.1 erythromycin esterase family protein [Cupriavidus necator H16]QQB78866.1 erythromycin esterase family protein [Cupriavidus necator]WKA43084.1 erythromycin esterase family protein [Cupriavidus necator]CAJ96338.1 erythromycin esterase homolog [Cupriavidus necator H16]
MPHHRAAPRAAAAIAAAAVPLPPIDDPAASPFRGPFANATGVLADLLARHRVVLLGESTHGTAEFYHARAALTAHLVARHGFRIIAVEADWPDAAAVDRHVRGRPPQPAESPGAAFTRFPVWMWRNLEVARFIRWLHTHNETLAPAQRTGFFGLDIYSLRASMAAVLAYLEGVDPQAARAARERYGCLEPWGRDPARYGRAVLHGTHADCEDAVVAQLQALLDKRLAYARAGHEDFLDAAQNARLVASAERYYRVMYHGSDDSWNLRDTHMFETLAHLLQAHGPQARAVVWAHNSHIGDASQTEMGASQGQLSIGQLCRESFGDDAALVGLSTYDGTVAAATSWDGPMEIKQVRPARADSYEHLFHAAGHAQAWIDLRGPSGGANGGVQAEVRQLLMPARQERFIGVIYRPETELQSHYARATLPRQFDLLLWFDRTRAVPALPAEPAPGAPETWPYGL